MRRAYVIVVNVESPEGVTPGDHCRSFARWVKAMLGGSEGGACPFRVNSIAVRMEPTFARGGDGLPGRASEEGQLVLVGRKSLVRLIAVQERMASDEVASDDELLNELGSAVNGLLDDVQRHQQVFALPRQSAHPLQVGMLTSAYNPQYERNGEPEYREDPPVKWTVEEADGLRILMGVLPGEPGTTFDDTADVPYVVLERNTDGCWTVFVCPDGGDHACTVHVEDNGHTTVVIDDWREDVEIRTERRGE